MGIQNMCLPDGALFRMALKEAFYASYCGILIKMAYFNAIVLIREPKQKYLLFQRDRKQV